MQNTRTTKKSYMPKCSCWLVWTELMGTKCQLQQFIHHLIPKSYAQSMFQSGLKSNLNHRYITTKRSRTLDRGRNSQVNCKVRLEMFHSSHGKRSFS